MNYSKKPKISVIMSNYNCLPYLKGATKSILTQTYKNFEFIIVDDNSSDESWKYLKSLKDRRIKLTRNNRNLGLAKSLNKALKVAKGDYIARMDSDDISLPNRLEEQLKFMQANPSIDICGTWVSIIDGENKKIGNIHYPSGNKDIKKTLRKVTSLIHPTWFAKAEMYKKLSGYRPVWDFVEDYDFLIRAENFKMSNIKKELLLWRSQANRRSNKDIQKMYEKSFKMRWYYFSRGKLSLLYFPYIFRSFITTYLFPARMKIYLNTKVGRR